MKQPARAKRCNEGRLRASRPGLYVRSGALRKATSGVVEVEEVLRVGVWGRSATRHTALRSRIEVRVAHVEESIWRVWVVRAQSRKYRGDGALSRATAVSPTWGKGGCA